MAFSFGSPSFDLQTNGNLTIAGNMAAIDYFYTSDREAKRDFEAVDPDEILSQVANLPITRWKFKQGKTPHIGPMGQDFYALFGVGQDQKHLSPTDTAGVALAAIQGLNRKLQEKDAEIQLLKARLAEIESMLSDR